VWTWSILLSFAVSVGTAPPADAHATLVRTIPIHGASVDEPPAVATLVFDEPVAAGLTWGQATTAAGRRIPTTPVIVGPRQVDFLLGDVGIGDTVELRWRVVSSVDGHVTAGTLAFGVGVPAPTVSADVATPVSAIELVGRWMFLSSVAALAGVALLDLGAATPKRGRRLRYAWGAAAIGVALITLGQWQTSGASIGTAVDSTVGMAGVRRMLAVLAIGGGVWAWKRRGRAAPVTIVAGCVAVVLVHATTSHAASSMTHKWMWVGVHATHAMAAMSWLGALLVLSTGWRGTEPTEIATVSRVATWSVVLVAGSGIALATRSLSHPSEALSTSYGRLLAAKAVLFFAMAGFGAWHRRGLNAGRTLHRATMRLEASMGLLAIVAVGALGVLVPPRSVAEALAPRLRVETVAFGPTLYTYEDPTGAVQVYADPGAAGANELHVTIFGPDGLEAVITNIDVFVDGGPAPSVRSLSPGHVVGDLDAGPGMLLVRVVVETGAGVRMSHDFEIAIEE